MHSKMRGKTKKKFLEKTGGCRGVAMFAGPITAPKNQALGRKVTSRYSSDPDTGPTE